MKTCCRCKIEKEKSDFSKYIKTRDGLNYRCRSCIKIERDINKHKYVEQKRLYRESVRKHKAKYDLTYRKENAEKIKQYKYNWDKKKRHLPIFKIKRNLRRRLHHVIKDGYKSDSTMNLLGCSFEEFKTYIESKFLPGMTWDNYGLGDSRWHLDHIRPCCDFNLLDAEEQRKCFHYTNVQPLWQKDNLKKGYIYNGKNCRI